MNSMASSGASPNRKDLVRKLLKGIETGDPEAAAVVSEDRYVQHNPQTADDGEGLAALFARISKSNPKVNLVRVFQGTCSCVATRSEWQVAPAH